MNPRFLILMFQRSRLELFFLTWRIFDLVKAFLFNFAIGSLEKASPKPKEKSNEQFKIVSV